MSFEFRPVRDRDEFAKAFYAIGQYFGAPAKEEYVDRWLQYFELARMHAAFDGDEVVGGAGAFTYDLSIPGGSLSCAGVTVVGVYPTHRRRGALRGMMEAQLADIHARGEPIAALWASEATIYGRFGYGLAAWAGEANIQRASSAFGQPLQRRGSTRFVSSEEAKTLFPPIYAELHRQRPGVFARIDAWWELRTLRMAPEQESNPKRFVVLEIDGRPEAYAIFRLHFSHEDGEFTSRNEVIEAIGSTAQGTAEIWRFLLDIDWVKTVTVSHLPLDHPLLFLLASSRLIKFRISDTLWIRLIDVGAALSGRAYAGEGSVVFAVRDATCPWNEGRWKLDGGKASRTDDEADLALDVDALGSAYLGAVSFAQLRDSFRVQELSEGAVARADALFSWHPLPWCPEIF